VFSESFVVNTRIARGALVRIEGVCTTAWIEVLDFGLRNDAMTIIPGLNEATEEQNHDATESPSFWVSSSMLEISTQYYRAILLP